MPRAFEVDETSISAVHQAFSDGSLTCRALVERYLARIAAFDQAGPCLNTVITLNPRALDLADALDAGWRDNRAACGPLHGIPILVKDNFDTADMPTTGSALALRDSQPRKDATVVARLKAAGAIVLAKTALTELAVAGTSAGSLHGQTLNPYDLTRTPGGSSGGTGAGLMPFSFTQDEAGPMARNAGDLARALDVMAGFDIADPVTEAAAGHVPNSYTAFLDPACLKGKRFGVLRAFFGRDAIHAEVNRVMARALDTLLDRGAVVFDIEIPDLATLTTDVGLGDYEMKAGLDRYLAALGGPIASFEAYVARGGYGPAVAAQVQAALVKSMDAPEYGAIFTKRGNLRKAVRAAMTQQKLDAIVYPHQRRLVAKVGDEQLERNGVLANATGLPAITVPGGFSSPSIDAPLGVPVGVEFLGREWSEGALMGIAYAFEQATRYRRPPAVTPPL